MPPDDSGPGDLAKISHILTLCNFVVRVDLVNKRTAVWDGWIRMINRAGVVGAVLQLDGVTDPPPNSSLLINTWCKKKYMCNVPCDM